MFRSIRSSSGLAAATACVALAGPIAAAQASDATIRGTINSTVPKIVKSQAKVLDGLATYDKTRSAKTLITAIKTQNGVLKALKGKLSRESASSANGAKGKADIVNGLGLIVRSNTALAKHLQSGKPLSHAEANTAITQDKKGNDDLNAGGKLLRV